MKIKTYKTYNGFITSVLLLFFSSCIDETYNNSETISGSFISVKGVGLRSATYPGDTSDNTVRTLRILSFNKVTGECTTNVRYDALLGEIIQHSIRPGDYDFIFLANEPSLQNTVNMLNAVSEYSDLNKIAFPASVFSSEQIIPMIQEIKNVTVLPDGKGAKLSNGTEVTLLELGLNRLGIRVDVVLEAKDNFDEALKGVTFSNVPDMVPLTANYTGPAIKRNVVRTFTQSENASYFSDTSVTSENATWAKKISRIILPSNELEAVGDRDKAVIFIVDMGSNYSPSCELKINSNPINYSLPINTKLDLLGIIKEPLEVNIKASPWEAIEEDWNISGNRILNVSHTEVNIRDRNGARISFWSNMPYVRVLETVKVKSSGNEANTNEIFNALSSQSYNPYVDERFLYNPQTGDGYMDILVERPDRMSEETYEITLAASEDAEMTVNTLQRKILVHVKSDGKHFDFIINSSENMWSHPYVGAFYRNKEKGERVITGIRYSYWDNWTATVPAEFHHFIVISSTPSFDPNIGTDFPGNPEDYPVIPNYQKGEDGTSITGKGRIYFRIGLKENNPSNMPRYGAVDVSYHFHGIYYTTRLYIRQGEEPDYLMRSGSSGTDYGQKFSPYNLTVSEFKKQPETRSKWHDIDYNDLDNEVGFVEYPTQAGAHFQWGLPIAYAALAHRAYHPTNVNMEDFPWEISGWPVQRIVTDSYWNPDNGDKLKDYYEVCPSGYYRPTDGPLNQRAVNSYNDTQVHMSDWRMSLFRIPMRGDASEFTVNKPYPTEFKPELYVGRILNEVKYGFYADGFFDRRPIRERNMILGLNRSSELTATTYAGVSLDNTQAAYGGVLVFNSDTNASLFFPAAGRRWYANGSLEYAGETGYYWSSSVAPGWTDTSTGMEQGAPFGNIWNVELNYMAPRPVSVSHLFGNTIRCVKK